MTVPAHFVHIGFTFNGPAPIEALERTFSKALDWMRYSQDCWILYTTTDSVTWRDRIHKTAGVSSDVAFFLVEFTGGEGYMHQWAWDWLNKAR